MERWTILSHLWMAVCTVLLTDRPAEGPASQTHRCEDRHSLYNADQRLSVITPSSSASPAAFRSANWPGLTVPLCFQDSIQKQQICLTDGDTDRQTVRISQHPARFLCNRSRASCHTVQSVWAAVVTG